MAAVKGGHQEVTTSASGNVYVAFSAQKCSRVMLSNTSGTTIQVRQGGAGVGLRIATGMTFPFLNIGDMSTLSIKRLDDSTTQVVVSARWEE